MGEQHGLGGLDVGRAGQDRGPLALGERDERALEVDAAPRPAGRWRGATTAEVRRDLVVARPTGVELARRRPDPVGQRGLQVEMDILEPRIPRDRPVHDIRGQPLEPPDQLPDLVRRSAGPPDRARGHGRSTPRGRRRELAVELDRAREVGDPPIVLLANRPPHRRMHPSFPVMLPA